MALIKCPECEKEISDKSEACIHCGYPIQKKENTKCIINGKEYDLSFLLDDKMDSKDKMITLRKIIPGTFSDTIRVLNEIEQTKQIPKALNIKAVEQKQVINVPKCPICNSTNIKKISTISKAGSVAMWGILSRKVHKQWHCNSCNSDF